MAEAFTYPSSVLDDPAALLSEAGSFWNTFYGGRDLVEAAAGARGQVELQTLNDLNEAADAAGRLTVPVFHTVRWLPITLLASQKLPGRVVTYGAGKVYGPQPVSGRLYTYGGPADASVGYPVPPEFRGTPLIMDQVLDANVTLVDKVDYLVDTDNGKLVFLSDPFLSPAFQQTAVHDAAGNEVDRQIVLWAFMSSTDKDLVWTQFGYVMGFRMPSGVGYKLLMNRLWEALTQGSTRGQMEDVLAAFVDAPYARGDETVEFVTADNVGTLVLTDKNVYRFGAAANVLVSPGDTLAEGQAITDTVRVYDLSRGGLPPVQAISLGRGFMHPDIRGDLVFTNKEMALTATVADDGHTVATFPIGGADADVAKFFELLDARGLADGRTLARVLDVRSDPVGEPSPYNLPATLNPLRFLVENVLRFNTILAVLDTSSAGPDAAGLTQTQLLRKLIPPTAALLLLIEVTGPGDSVTMLAPVNYGEALAPSDDLGPGGDTTADGSFADALQTIAYV